LDGALPPKILKVKKEKGQAQHQNAYIKQPQKRLI
jgi:hypothetical protein